MLHPDQAIARIRRLLASSDGGYLDAVPKLLAHPARLHHFLTGHEERITPVNLEIWPALTCNARCPRCPYRMNRARAGADASDDFHGMDLATWARLAGEFRDAGGLSVTFTGGGDPTMHPDLPAFARIARRHGLTWGLYSNGYALTPTLSEQLLAHRPRFIRISVNSASPAEHQRIYGLGADGYRRVREHLIALLRHAPPDTTVGIGYVFSRLDIAQAQGIARFVHEIGEAAPGLGYVAVRPEVVYWRGDGSPRERQPDPVALAAIPALCRREIGPVCERHGVRLQINHSGFRHLADATAPGGCLGTEWATSATHSGEFYLLSEANGSPRMTDLRYDRTGASFRESWFGARRLALSRAFARGQRRAPAWHKLSGVDGALRRLRRELGVLTPDTARQVVAGLEDGERPAHWEFI